MKQLLFVFLFVALSSACAAQAKLGFSREDVRKFLVKKDYPYKENFDKYGHYNFKATEEAGAFYYYFDAKDKCHQVIIVPSDQDAINALVEYYNHHYVVVSSTKWKMYTATSIANIELRYADGGCGFVWEMEN